MTVETLLTRSVTLLTRTKSGTDDYGNTQWDTTEREVQGELQRVQQGEGDEPGSAGEFSATEWRLFLSAADGPAVVTSDAVEVDGATYEVVGAPWAVWDPKRGQVHHVEVALKAAQ